MRKLSADIRFMRPSAKNGWLTEKNSPDRGQAATVQ